MAIAACRLNISPRWTGLCLLAEEIASANSARPQRTSGRLLGNTMLLYLNVVDGGEGRLTALRGRRVFQPGERLFQVASQLVLYHDMQSIAFDVVKERPAKSFVHDHYANHVSTLFGVCVQMPIYYPFAASFNPALAGPVKLTIFDGGMPPGLDEHTSHVMGAATLMIWSMAFVFFYEQQLDGMTAKFGERTRLHLSPRSCGRRPVRQRRRVVRRSPVLGGAPRLQPATVARVTESSGLPAIVW